MAFPNLTLGTGGYLHSEGTGVPSNGINTFAHNLPVVDNPSWIQIQVIAGASITNAVLVSITATNISINFTQTGVDSAQILATLIHTIYR